MEVRKQLSIFTSALVMLFVSFSIYTSPAAAEDVDAVEPFILGKGINLAHWLSQTKRKGQDRRQFIVEADFERIAALGFDHVRLPIDEKEMWSDSGERDNDAFAAMQDAVRWSIEHDLKVLVDLHILRSHHFNAKTKPLWTEAAAQEKFINLWVDLSAALKDYPADMLAYELMNEPVADDPADWNALVAKAFAAVRLLEPMRWIAIGSNRWQSAHTFDELEVPDDQRIILSYHFYEPFLLSHYKTSWTPVRAYEGPVHYPGVIVAEAELDGLSEEELAIAQDWVGRSFDRDILVKMMAKPLAKAKELGLPLYCGEYGIFNTAPSVDRLRWYRDMSSVFSEFGISSAAWNYKSDAFGIVNNDGSENSKMIKAILNE